MTTKKKKDAAKVSKFIGSMFTNCRANLPYAYISLEDWIEKICNGSYKEPVLAYRNFKERGEKEMADSTKHALDAFICRGKTPKGRKENCPIENESDLQMVDYDNHDMVWSAEQVLRMQRYKWTVAAYQTIGGGLRLFVQMPHFDVKYYKLYTKVALEELDRLVGYPHDASCDHRMRMTLPSYDEHAWCRPSEECTEVFPISEEGMAKIRQKIDNKEHQLFSDYNLKIDYKKMHFNDERHFSEEQILQKMDYWLNLCPYVTSQHHNSLLLGGSMARHEDFTTADLAEMAKLVRKRFPVEGYDFQEVLRNLNDGFQLPGIYTKAIRANRCVADGYDNEDDYDNSQKNDEIIDSTCPYFSKEIYDALPTIITSLLIGIKQKRLRDIYMMSILTAISAAMANVKCYYRSSVYSANLAFCAIAKAGSGKGICKESRKLLQPIQDEYDETFRREYSEYKGKLRQWHADQLQAQKEGKEFNIPEPKEPTQVNFINSEVTSLSRFIDDQVSSPHGGILYVEELAVYNHNERGENGGLTATHRKVIMNENVSKNYIKCGKVEVKIPKCSYIFLGTDKDFIDLVHTVQDGTLSRFAILTGNTKLKWDPLDKSVYNRKSVAEAQERMEAASKYVLDLFHFLEKYPTDVFFPEEKFDEFNSFFDYSTEMIQDLGHDELSSVVFRAPITCLRIGTILSCMRKFEAGDTTRELDIHPDDFDTALAMTKILLRHASQYSTLLPNGKDGVKKMKPVNTVDLVYRALPDEFEAKQGEAMFKVYGMSHTTAFKYMGMWVQQGKATDVSGHYTKVKDEATSSNAK